MLLAPEPNDCMTNHRGMSTLGSLVFATRRTVRVSCVRLFTCALDLYIIITLAPDPDPHPGKCAYRSKKEAMDHDSFRDGP